MTETENEKYEIAEGIYITRNSTHLYGPSKSFDVPEKGKYRREFYLTCHKTNKHVVIKEKDLQKAVQSIYPDCAFYTEDIVSKLSCAINYSKPPEEPIVEVIKLEKEDNTATYFLLEEGPHYFNLYRVGFLHENLSLDQPENIDKIKAYQGIGWPIINGTSTSLASKMKERGYVVEHSGSSCFETRNRFIISTKDNILTPEIYLQMKNDMQECVQEIEKEKEDVFDAYFDEMSSDPNKVFSLVRTGYDYYRTRTVNEQKYYTVAKDRIACTRDFRCGMDHIYLNLMINVERMKADKRKFVVFEVPQDMIGMVIGKGGKNLKKIEEMFGKRFKVVQSREEKEAQKRQKHLEDFNKLKKDVVKTVGDNVLLADEQGLQKAVDDYMETNKQSLPFMPNADELKDVYAALCEEKERKIAEQQYLEAEKIRQHKRNLKELQDNIRDSFGEKFLDSSDAYVAQRIVDYMTENKENLPLQPDIEEMEYMRQNLIEQREEQIAKQLEQDKKASEDIFEQLDSCISDYAWDNDHELPPDEEVKKYISEFVEGKSYNPAYERVAEKTGKEIIIMLQKESLRDQLADKKFDEVATKALENFFKSDKTGVHGENFFLSVGKTRRANAYEYLANQVMKKLGLADQENQLLPSIQEHRSYKYCNKIIDFVQDSSGYVDYNFSDSQEEEVEQPVEQPKEPTLENLAAVWGAKLEKEK